jgi:hypothetical protein
MDPAIKEQYKGTELPRHTQTKYKLFINMAKIESHMSPEDLENNYEYKVVKRALMREYPWIKDVRFNPEELDIYNLIFLELIVDPEQMGESYGWEMTPWIKSSINNGHRYSGNYPSLLFRVTYEEGKDEVTQPIDKMMRDIHDSPALPQDLRLPSGRQFQVGSFTVNPDGEPW